jgi:hypothetical protein
MSKINLGPGLVYENLRMYLDAGNDKSYPGSGNTWYDLSGNNNHGTLNNTTFDSEKGGCFSFNGTTSYVNLNGGSALNNWNPDATTIYSLPSYTSACFWFKTDTTAAGNATLFTDGYGYEYGVYRNSSNIAGVCYGGGSAAISANIWYYVCLTALNRTPNTGTYSQSGTTTATFTTTYPIPFTNSSVISITRTSGSFVDGNYTTTIINQNTFTVTTTGPATTSGNFFFSTSQNQANGKLYLNGEYKSTGSANISNGANDVPFNIGRDGGLFDKYFSGKIANCQLYDRRLTDAEVLQNYNHFKTRFGL